MRPERLGSSIHYGVMLGLEVGEGLFPVPLAEVGEPAVELGADEAVPDLDVGGRALAEAFVEALGDVGNDERTPDGPPGGSLDG